MSLISISEKRGFLKKILQIIFSLLIWLVTLISLMPPLLFLLSHKDATLVVFRFELAASVAASAGAAFLYCATSAELRHDFLMAKKR